MIYWPPLRIRGTDFGMKGRFSLCSGSVGLDADQTKRGERTLFVFSLSGKEAMIVSSRQSLDQDGVCGKEKVGKA